MNLYETTLPGARLTDAYHNGLLLVYFDALSVTALAVFQLPREAVLPVLYIGLFELAVMVPSSPGKLAMCPPTKNVAGTYSLTVSP